MKTVIDELLKECEANSFNTELKDGSDLIVVDMDELRHILNDKKEAHKQEIIEAYNAGAKDPFPICKLGAEYYKETFNK